MGGGKPYTGHWPLTELSISLSLSLSIVIALLRRRRGTLFPVARLHCGYSDGTEDGALKRAFGTQLSAGLNVRESD